MFGNTIISFPRVPASGSLSSSTTISTLIETSANIDPRRVITDCHYENDKFYVTTSRVTFTDPEGIEFEDFTMDQGQLCIYRYNSLVDEWNSDCSNQISDWGAYSLSRGADEKVYVAGRNKLLRFDQGIFDEVSNIPPLLYTCIVVSRTNGNIFAFSNVLAIELLGSTLKHKSVTLMQDSTQCTSVYLHRTSANEEVAFIGTSRKAFRLDLKNRAQFSTPDIATSGVTGLAFSDNLLAVTKDDNDIHNISPSDCSALGCYCQTDPFCGVCSVDLQCKFQDECSGPLHTEYECPVGTHDISTGDISGGTNVTFTFNYIERLLDDASDTKYRCIWGSDEYPPISIVENKITCRSPSQENPGNVNLQLVFLIQESTPISWSNVITFTYYDCSELTCSQCLAEGSECGWIRNDALCSKGGEDTCNTIVSIEPPAVPSHRQELIVITPDYPFHADQFANYRCRFDNIIVPHSEISENFIVCETPNLDGVSKTMNLVVLLNDREFTLPKNLHFYTCELNKSCRECASENQRCTWDIIDGCQDAISPTTMFCPVFNDIFDMINIDITENIALTGRYFSNVANVRCKYTFGEDVQEFDMQFVSSSSIQCPRPTHTGSGTLQLVHTGGNPYTDPTPITTYSCSSANTCDHCFSDSRPSCNWCTTASSFACLPQGDSACLTPMASCPIISHVDPSKFVVGRPIDILVTLSAQARKKKDITGDVSCVLSSETGIVGDVDGDVDGDTVHCVFPAIMTKGLYSLELFVNGALYSNTVDYEIFECGDLIQCDKCLGEVESNFCDWCSGGSCTTSGGCTNAFASCPKILLDSFHYAIEGNDEIDFTVQPGPIAGSPSSYECVFVLGSNTQVVPASRSGSDFQCTTDPFPSAGSYNFFLRATGENVVNFAVSDTELNIFSCSEGSRCTDSCLTKNLGHCVYCTSQQACVPNNLCVDREYVWDSSHETCPVAHLEKEYSTLEASNISIIFNRVFIGLATKHVYCEFRLVSEQAEFVPESVHEGEAPLFTKASAESDTEGNTKVTCRAPGVEINQGHSVVASLNVAIYAAPSQPTDSKSILMRDLAFSWVDCPISEADVSEEETWCEVCNIRRNNHCGFCLDTFSCSTSESCENPDSFSDSTFSCPTLIDLSPSAASIGGGTTVLIKGTKITESENLRVMFGEYEATVVSIENDTITVTTPTSKSAGDIQVRVYYGSYLYSRDALEFSFVRDGLSIGAILGIVFAILLLIAIALLILLYMKIKRVGYFRKQLEEPNYLQIAFGKHLEGPHYILPKDNFKTLEKALLEYNHEYLFAISRHVPLTEHDKFAKSLIALFHSHGFAKEVVVAMISEEVAKEKSENTIFRGNSITSKLFKFYSKILGVRFLWSKTARLIIELNNIGAERMKEESKPPSRDNSGGGSSLLSMEMEIDPNKTGTSDTDEDTQANVYQLIVTCQKIFGSLLRSLKEMPVEFRDIFCACEQSIRDRFGSAESVYKTIGGFLFLRFICPAFTAPHAYGLLTTPPNKVTQRQLVLIGKVLQNLANMTIPTHKEAFMLELVPFFEKNIPKMREFYLSILIPPTEQEIQDQRENCQLPILPEDVSENVKMNALGEICSIIVEIKRFDEKIDEDYANDPDRAERVKETQNKILRKYSSKKSKKEKRAKKKDMASEEESLMKKKLIDE